MTEQTKKSRLQTEYENWKNLSVEELAELRVGFLESRNIIDHELKEAEGTPREFSDWYKKAYGAYKIYGVKLTAIETLIGQKRENFKFYKNFYFEAKNLLEANQFDRIFERAKVGAENYKSLP